MLCGDLGKVFVRCSVGICEGFVFHVLWGFVKGVCSMFCGDFWRVFVPCSVGFVEGFLFNVLWGFLEGF